MTDIGAWTLATKLHVASRKNLMFMNSREKNLVFMNSREKNLVFINSREKNLVFMNSREKKEKKKLLPRTKMNKKRHKISS